MMHPSSEDVKARMRLLQRAEERSTRTLMCAGYVRADSVVVFFPKEIRGPVIVAKDEIEPIDDPWKRVAGLPVEASRDGELRDTQARDLLRQRDHSRGYRTVTVSGDTRYVHRLVARAFHGAPPSEDHQVNHKNGDKSDNRPQNLEWVTYDENRLHALESGLIDSPLTKKDVEEMRQRRSEGETVTSLAEDYGIDNGTVSRICRGETWSCIPLADDHEDPGFARGDRVAGSKLTETDVIRLRRRVRSGESRSALADEFGVSASAVGRAVNGKTWEHVTEEPPVKEPLGRLCSWCREPLSGLDRDRMEDGAKVTHTICPTCRDENFPPPAA